MPAYPITDKEEIDELVDEIFHNTEDVVDSITVHHEWLMEGGFVLNMTDGRKFLLSISKVAP